MYTRAHVREGVADTPTVDVSKLTSVDGSSSVQRGILNDLGFTGFLGDYD